MLHVRKKKKKNALLEKKERKEKGICNCHQLPQLGIHAFQAPAPKKRKRKRKRKKIHSFAAPQIHCTMANVIGNLNQSVRFDFDSLTHVLKFNNQQRAKSWVRTAPVIVHTIQLHQPPPNCSLPTNPHSRVHLNPPVFKTL
jgi:hypothetical protein